MSRFFASALDSESSSEEEQVEVVRRKPILSFSSDEEEGQRVVLPAKNKFRDEIKIVMQAINNSKKINDYSSLLARFEELLKIVGKFQSLIKTAALPRTFIAGLAELELFVSTAWNDVDGRKSLTKNSYKALANLRQKVRKFCKGFQENIAEYFLHPDNFVSDEEEVEEIKEKVEVDSDSTDWGDSDSESSEFDATENLREKFLKKSTTVKEETKKERKIPKVKKVVVEDEDGEWETVRGGSTEVRQKLFDGVGNIDSEIVAKKLDEITAKRGRVHLKRLEKIQLLEDLCEAAEENSVEEGLVLKIKLAEITALLDYKSSAIVPMKEELWSKLVEKAKKFLQFAESLEVEFSPDLDPQNEKTDPPIKLRGSLAAMMERIIDNYHIILKNTDQFSNTYIEKLKDGPKIDSCLDLAISIVEKSSQVLEICRLKLCKIEQIYFKFDKTDPVTAMEKLDKLCRYLYVHDPTQRLRTRAILAQIYHLALHDQWIEARNLMLMSHLQSNIQHADSGTQIMFNRTMAQLGLCAFRLGFIEESHDCLMGLWTSGAVRELLGQGHMVHRNMQRTREQELKENLYQVPFHMQIQLDQIECAYLVSAMLLHVPNMTRETKSGISKSFYQLLRSTDRLTLVGPPESKRDYIVAAACALRLGNWRDCVGFIFSPKMETTVWGLFQQKAPIKENLTEVIRREALKAYLLGIASVYETLSISQLCSIFEMEETAMVGFLARMITEGSLSGSINLKNETLVLAKEVNRSRLQNLALHLTDKFSTLQELLEKCNATKRAMTTRFNFPIAL